MPVRCIVEFLNDLFHGLERFKVCGEVHFLLFEVNEVLIGLPQRCDWFIASPVVEVYVLKQLSQRRHVFLLVCLLEIWVFSEYSLNFSMIYP